MMKKFYIYIWSVAAVAALAFISAVPFDAIEKVLLSFMALGLFYTLALWSVTVRAAKVADERVALKPN